MLSDEFDIHLFSNSSMSLYPSNSLSSFTCELSTPIYLGENHNYSVALTDIYIPPAFDNVNTFLSKDSIIIRNYNYPQIIGKSDAKFDDFIEVILKMSPCDIRIYNKAYFGEYLNKDLCFNNNTLKSTTLHKDNVEVNPSDHSKFPLNLTSLKLINEKNEDFLPPVVDEKLKKFYENSVVLLNYNQNYTLKQVLYSCIKNILKELDWEAIKSTKNDDELKKKYESYDKIYESIKKYNFKLNELVHRFVEKFVTTVERIRDEIVKFLKLKYEHSVDKFVIVYSDICKYGFFGDTKVKVLGVFQNVTNEILEKAKTFHFVPVESTLIKNISIILANESGQRLNLSPSLVPTLVVLKFKKMN